MYLTKQVQLQNGKPKVIEIVSKIEENELLQIAGSLEQNSEHPLAEAILEKIKETEIEPFTVEEFSSVSGRGVFGRIQHKLYFGGNLAFMKENAIDTQEIENDTNEFLKQGKTVLYFANEKSVIGAISVADTIKETSYEAIQNLKRKQIEVVMLTGDNSVVADSIGKKLGLDKVISEVLPQEKEREISKLQEQGKKVAFVGDGINDSPALVKADVGLAIASGTDIAMDSADIVLMKNNLLDVATAIDLSKAVIRNIKMNLFWAFFYNCVGIPIAAGVFYLGFGLKLNPMIGALAMSLSSVCVVTNALRLRKFKSVVETPKIKQNKKEEKIMIKTIFVEGMQCNHCKMSVEKALGAIEGVEKVEVSLEEKKAVIEMTKEIEDNKIKEVIEEAGFTVK